jgi:uncharacterized protein YbcC (UPF0753/DUF2309 family)
LTTSISPESTPTAGDRYVTLTNGLAPTGDETLIAEPDDLRRSLQRACRRIAPLFPLERFVAVNPYLGLTDHHFHEAAARLAQVAGAHTTMNDEFYLDAIDQGRIAPQDVAEALKTRDRTDARDGAEFLRSVGNVAEPGEPGLRVPTIAGVATARTGQDWAGFATDRVSAWAAAYFDDGQAIWRSADRTLPLFAAWKEEASIDRTPEVMGLRGFRATVRSLPDDPVAAAEQIIARLAIPTEGLELYLHALLLSVGGWAAYAARVVWDRQLLDEDDDTLVQFLAVLLAWEFGILVSLTPNGLPAEWDDATRELSARSSEPAAQPSLARLLVLQDAFDRSEQRRLIDQFASNVVAAPALGARPATQIVFCIDVRSEVLRRHLEATAPAVDTIGFAGFFGVPIDYVPLAHDRGEAQCPVLLRPAYVVPETVSDPNRLHEIVERRRLRHHVRRAWKSFKMGAVSCFSFVGPVGLIYLPKLFTDSRGSTRPVKRSDDESLGSWGSHHKGPDLTSGTPSGSRLGIPLAGRVQLAEGALRGMSLTDGFAPLVLMVGHGATTVNNPYDTGLDCGACGGHTGEANSRVATAILNDAEVRQVLAGRGIAIPDDTCFVAALHNTTTDEVTLFDLDPLPAGHAPLVAEIQDQLTEAGRRARVERSQRLAIADTRSVDAAVRARSTDWAQVRPEWGLAGCRTFVAAPRNRTRGLDLEGRCFLHSYDWRQDEGFAVLDLIMTAPMVVASWISLQYYASTVDNRVFGSGNKTLHNVVGRIGVLEGNAGDLRTGLPWQSVHDGQKLQHEPLRLTVVIEAPTEAISDVIAAHQPVRDLCDNGWLQLLAMDSAGSITHRYGGQLRWDPIGKG